MAPQRRALSLIAILALGQPVLAQNAPPLTAEQEEVFALLDRFDPLDTRSLQFVRVVDATGSKPLLGQDLPHGFLLEPGRQFSVRLLDLERWPAESGLVPVGKWAFEPADLEQYAAEIAARLQQLKSDWFAWQHYTAPGEIMPPAAIGLLVARACARRGLRTAVHAIWSTLPSPDEARADLGLGLYHWVEQSYADPKLTRADLLAKHRAWLEGFGNHWLRDAVAKRVAVLEPMVDEDRRRVEKASEPADQTAVIAGLVYALRDQFLPVRQALCDGWYLAPLLHDEQPASGLEALGLAAAPALIAALDDDRPSRCVFYLCRYGGSFMVQSVGELARALLEATSGLSCENKAQWQAWYAEASTMGEDAALATAVRSNYCSVPAAERLLKHWPHRIGDVIFALRKTSSPYVREGLVDLVAREQDPQVIVCLEAEVKSGPFVRARVRAAVALLDRGRREGLDRIVADWIALRTAPPDLSGPGIDADKGTERREAASVMAAFLLRSGDPAAVRTLGDGLLGLAPALCLGIVDALEVMGRQEILARTDATAVERMLVALLDNPHREEGMPTTSRYAWIRPRIADFAALELASLWPERFPFAPDASTRGRDQQIAAMRNTWRVAHGQQAIAVPGPPTRSQTPALQALLLRLREQGFAGKADLQSLGEQGLDALPGIESVLAVMPASAPGRSELAALAQQRGNTVQDVLLDAGGAGVPADLSAMVTSMKGALLTETTLLELMLVAARSLPGGRGWVSLEAERVGDGTGVVVSLRLQGSNGSGTSGGGLCWAAQLGENMLRAAAGSGVRDMYDDVSDFDDQRKEIATVLAASRTTPFLVQLHLRWD